jgi:hypothetical protein
MIGTTADFARPPPGRPGSPPPRSGFEAVYSRDEDAAWVLGGQALSDGQPLHDLWMRRVERPGEWREVKVAGYEPAAVLAAIWSYADRRLWVLDATAGEPPPECPAGKVLICHIPQGNPANKHTLCVGKSAVKAHLGHGDTLGPCEGETGKPMARLVRIDPYLGVAEPVAQLERAGEYDRHWLLTDVAGQVLLVASSASKQSNAVARLTVVPFRAAAPVLVERMEVLPGELAFAPLVDVSGYTFVIAGPGGWVVDRREELGGIAAPLSKLGEVL